MCTPISITCYTVAMKYEMRPGRLELIMSPAEEGRTLQAFCDDLVIPAKKQKKLELLVNRAHVQDLSAVLHAGDTLTIPLESEEVDYTPAERECRIIYEDDLVYVAHKYPGMIVHNGTEDTETLAAQAARYQLNAGIHAPVRYIHRLDRETTGLVLFVKVPLLQGWYDRKLQEKAIIREYLAICAGKARAGQKFTFNDRIGRDRHVSGKYRVSESGREACTYAECLERKGPYALFRCTLDTGRTHQIRVHLSAHKQPIVNDPLYGVPDETFRQMGLWAYRISFPDPFTGEIITAEDFPNRDYRMFRSMKK